MKELHGVLVVDKPAGPTSHDVVEGVRRALGVRKAGHTGTLDPFAGRHTSSSGKSGCIPRKSMPKVGRRGHGESKKCMGKLLAIPPSENQLKINARLPDVLE